MLINCSNPVIIINPYAKYYIPLFGSYMLCGRVVTLTEPLRQKYARFFPYEVLSPKKNNITCDDVDNCCIFDAETGMQVPLYLVVPCGKCPLCLDRKSSDWAFRILCESQYSTTIPMFATLTYNDKCLPADGVNKDDCQRFLKRLREHCKRKFGADNVRYYLCAEYTPEYKRPHYHVLLFNLPALSYPQLIGLIRETWNLGFIKVSPISYGRITYCLKYMRKKQDVPDGKNPVFFLASRREGIGAQWLKANTDFFYKHPAVGTVSLTDKYSGQTITQAIPTYFKRKLYPSLSGMFPKEIIDAWREVNELYLKRELIDEELELPLHWSVERTILTIKFASIPLYTCDRALFKKDSGITAVTLVHTGIYDEIEDRIHFLEQVLLDYRFDIAKVHLVLSLRDINRQSCSDYAAKNPVTQEMINSRLDAIKKREKIQDSNAILR